MKHPAKDTRERLTLSEVERSAEILRNVKRVRGGKRPAYVRFMREPELRRHIETCRELWVKRGDYGAFYDGLLLSAILVDRAYGPSKSGTRSSRDLLPMPRWIVDECLKRCKADLLTARWGDGRGRTARWLERYRQDRIDFGRWDTVVALLDRGMRWDGVFRAASIDLRGTYAAGSESAVRHSWRRVQRRGGAVSTYESYFVRPAPGPKEIL